jgi:hypothetical protein
MAPPEVVQQLDEPARAPFVPPPLDDAAPHRLERRRDARLTPLDPH